MSPQPKEKFLLVYKRKADTPSRPPPFKCAQPNVKYADVNDLPPELLREIFLLYTSQPCPPPFLGSADEGPVVLSQVCRRWRAICFSFPALWASFSYSLTAIKPTRPSRLRTAISHVSSRLAAKVDTKRTEWRLKKDRPIEPSIYFAEWIQRSAPTPLEIDVCFDPYQENGTSLLVPNAEELLFDQAERWKALSTCLHGSFAERFLDLDANATPRLEQLVLDGQWDRAYMLLQFLSIQSVSAFVPKIASLSSLKDLWIRGYSSMIIEDLNSLQGIPFERLDRLAFEIPMRMWDAYHIIRRCLSAKLVVLQFIEEKWEDSFGHMEDIRLPMLEELVLATCHVTGDIFRALDAPKLSYLSVTDGRPAHQIPIEDWEDAVKALDKDFKLRQVIDEAPVAEAFERASLFEFCLELDPRRATMTQDSTH